MKPADRLTMNTLLLAGLFSLAYFGGWWFSPERVHNPVLYGILSVSIWFFIVRYFGYAVVFSHIKPHQYKIAPSGLTVDAMTTAAPGEPIEMTQKSLLALKAMTYPHETWLLDDSNNPVLQDFCAAEGIHYVARTQKIHAKCGNVNNGLRQSSGDFVMIIDPDHVVQPNYLDRVLGEFRNPEVGFVQTTQAYYNQPESFVATGGAEQTYMFYGPVMQGLAGMGSNLVIGTNCTFRRAALESIDLYKPGLAEDLHTSMALHSQGWKGAYVPEVLARGLTPGDLGSFCHQQLKWSRGVLDLFIKHAFGYAKGWTWKQRFAYLLCMSYYFESVMMLINVLLPLYCLFAHQYPAHAPFGEYLTYMAPLLLVNTALFFFSQKWVCHPSERGLMIRGMLLHYLSFPFHILGIVYAALNRKIPYIATSKTTDHSIPVRLILPQVFTCLISGLVIVYGILTTQSLHDLNMLGFVLWNALTFAVAMTYVVEPQRQLARLPILSRHVIGALAGVGAWSQSFVARLSFGIRFAQRAGLHEIAALITLVQVLHYYE